MKYGIGSDAGKAMQRTLTTTRAQDNHRRSLVRRPAWPVWFVMTDEDRLPDPGPLIPHLPPGSAVIVRHRDASAAASMASGLLPLARAHDVLVLLSAHTPPKRLHADGLHIPEAALKFWAATDFVRLSPALITSSAHSLNAVMKAERLGVDAVLLSPVFPTRSHAGAASLGLHRFAAISRHARNAGLPIIALGGITPERTRRTLCAGASGIAGIGLFTPGGHSRVQPNP